MYYKYSTDLIQVLTVIKPIWQKFQILSIYMYKKKKNQFS